MSVKKAAQEIIKDGKFDEKLLNMVEMSIRAYDPCFSCATHDLDGRMPVKLNIVDASGKIVETLTN
jgi:F420-non-reducing hydrogenase large subunit